MNKYRNKKVKIDGYNFDSKKESEKYLELCFLKKNKQILDFEVHPKFLILEGFEKDGQKVRPIFYEADFKIYEIGGKVLILDIKPFNKSTGRYFLTPVFRLKAKMFDKCYPDLTLMIE